MCKKKKKEAPVFLNHKEKAIVDGATGEVYRPACWIDLSAYVGYLEGINQSEKAQDLLRKVLKGERVITDMHEKAQRVGLGIEHSHGKSS